MAKHIIKISILLAWLGLMGWWWLESRTWPVPEKINAAFLPDFNDYYSLAFGDQKIGWANKSLRRVDGGGYQGLQSLTIKLAARDQVVDASFSVVANFDRLLNLIDFRYIIQAGPVVVTESGLVSPRKDNCPVNQPCDPGSVAEPQLAVEVNLGAYGPVFQSLVEEHRDLLGGYAELLDFSRPVEIYIPAGPVLIPFLPPYLSYLGLTPGTNYSMNMLDPINRALMPITMRVENEAREYDPETGREIQVYRVRVSSAGGGGLLWLDRYGRTLREESLGFKLERIISLASKYEEPSLAARGAAPLKLPPGLQRVLAGREMDVLMEKISESTQSHQNREQNQSGSSARPENRMPEKND